MRENSSEDKNDITDCFHIEDFKNLWEFRMACTRRDWHLSRQTHCRPFHFNIVQLPPSGCGKAFLHQELEEAELAKDKKMNKKVKKGAHYEL